MNLRIVPAVLLMVFCLSAAVCATEDLPLKPAPDIAQRVGGLLAEDYYDQARIRPHLMIERALRTLEGADVSVDTTWLDGVILLRVADQTWSIDAPDPKTLPQTMAILDSVRKVLEGPAGFDPKRGRDLGYAMINGALMSLDPHTVLMPPEPADDFDEDIRGEFGGIGAYLHQEADTGEVIIERVMPERPAEKSGVEDGDVIAAVNGESTAGLSLEQCVRRIKGPKGTTVTLTLRRKAQVIELPVVRDIVQVPSMRSYRRGDIGYIRMDEFNARTARSLFDEVMNLQGKGALTGLVLDLRFNGGGLLEQARVISDFFLEKDKEIVRTVTLGGEPHKFFSSPRRLLDCPMMVLVGPGSASAAEILSGALQCNDRAVIIGSTTFGKGSVQSIRPLSDGSRLKLTIQEYRLADGVSIQDVGVMPDVRLNRRMLRDDHRVDLIPYTSSREKDEEFALVVGDMYQHATTYELGWMAEAKTRDELRKSSISSRDFEPDQESSMVMDLFAATLGQAGVPERLKAAIAAGTERQALLTALQAPISARAEREAETLATMLSQMTPPVTWGPEGIVAPGSLTVVYTGPKVVNPGQTVDITFDVINSTIVDIGRIYGVMVSDRASPLFEDEVVIGKIPASGKSIGSLSFAVPPRLYPGFERFSLELHQDGSSDILATLPVTIEIADIPRPHLSFDWSLAGDVGLPAGGTGQLVLRFKNDGTGDSAPLSVSVYKDNDREVELGEGVFRLGGIPAGKEIEVSVPITRAADATNKELIVLVHAEERFDELVDARYRASLYHKLTIPLGKDNPHGVVTQPQMVLSSLKLFDNYTAELSVKIVGDNVRFVGVFHDKDKIDLRPTSELIDQIYTLTLKLKPGLNSVRVVASGADDITELLPIRLWGPDAELQAQNAKPVPPPAVVVETLEPIPAIIP